MATIGLVDFDGKLTNFALMQASAWHKSQGNTVILNPNSPDGIDLTYVSLIFTNSREKAHKKYGHYPNVQFGGTGESLAIELPPEIASMRPDYNLYTPDQIYKKICQRPGKKEDIMKLAVQICNAGCGFTTRGCVMSCPWCAVPRKEGHLKQVATISDLVNPRSRLLTLLDNSFTADPLCLEKLEEIEERDLIINISQGIDVRRVTPDIAHALSQVKHWKSLHYAWDQAETESAVFKGINELSRYIKKSHQMCYCLCGYKSSFEEDMYRLMTLIAQGIRPYVMLFRPLDGSPQNKSPYELTRLQHLKRWINAPKSLFKKVPFEEYAAWVKAREKMPGAVGATQRSLFGDTDISPSPRPKLRHCELAAA